MKKPKRPPPAALPPLAVGTQFRFEILGPPATKKNSKRAFVNKTTGRAFIAASNTARAWGKTASEQLMAQWHRRPLAIGQPVRMSAIIYRLRATGDLLNFLAAASDALQDAEVIVNDVQVVCLNGCRLDKDKANPRIDVTLTILDS